MGTSIPLMSDNIKPLFASGPGRYRVALNQPCHQGRRCGRYFPAASGPWLCNSQSAGCQRTAAPGADSRCADDVKGVLA